MYSIGLGGEGGKERMKEVTRGGMEEKRNKRKKKRNKEGREVKDVKKVRKESRRKE